MLNTPKKKNIALAAGDQIEVITCAKSLGALFEQCPSAIEKEERDPVNHKRLREEGDSAAQEQGRQKRGRDGEEAVSKEQAHQRRHEKWHAFTDYISSLGGEFWAKALVDEKKRRKENKKKEDRERVAAGEAGPETVDCFALLLKNNAPEMMRRLQEKFWKSAGSFALILDLEGLKSCSGQMLTGAARQLAEEASISSLKRLFGEVVWEQCLLQDSSISSPPHLRRIVSAQMVADKTGLSGEGSSEQKTFDSAQVVLRA